MLTGHETINDLCAIAMMATSDDDLMFSPKVSLVADALKRLEEVGNRSTIPVLLEIARHSANFDQLAMKAASKIAAREGCPTLVTTLLTEITGPPHEWKHDRYLPSGRVIEARDCLRFLRDPATLEEDRRKAAHQAEEDRKAKERWAEK